LSTAPPLESRLHWSYIDRWLKKNKVPLRKIESGEPFWPTSEGLIALTVADIERLISIDDPVAWAWLNLTERDAVRDDDGTIITPAGSPWGLFPCQAELARIKGNLIVECGAEVGKTRDIILGTLSDVDAHRLAVLIATDSDITNEEIWSELEFQLEANALIGGGVIDSSVKPFREKVFANGGRFQMRLCGHDGKQFRGGHFDRIRADEAAKWKNAQQWNELWRAGRPGSSFRIYSTPDGDYSSPFYALCERAQLGKGVGLSNRARSAEDEPRFKKINITKMQMPAPFWSEARAAKYREQYGGENSVGWQTNVLGRWGSPSYSVFPMPSLKPCLKYLDWYRIVVALIDRERGRVQLRAARLSPEIDQIDGSGRREEMLLRTELPLLDGKDLGAQIAAFFPSIADWPDPLIYCGGDLGSATDPTELIFLRRTGLLWADVFRLHLQNADWPVQADIVAALDHASGHRVRYGFDNGSAGSALAQSLVQMPAFQICPAGCKAQVFFGERLKAFGFGDYCDEVDIETGETIPNPDKLDAGGAMMPHRLSNKEFSTRVLERKIQAKQLAIAPDAGAEDQRLAAAQLLVNHTYSGVTGKGERRFKGQDDHHVDARRQAALVIASAVRGEPFVPPDPATIGRLPASIRSGGLVDAGITAALDRSSGSRIFAGSDW
jgi:hypothetical protein